MKIDVPLVLDWEDILRQRRSDGDPFFTRYRRDDAADAVSITALEAMRQNAEAQRTRLVRQEEQVKEFRKAYVAIRTNNVVLDHQSAIELAKMIYEEAGTITYKDIK